MEAAGICNVVLPPGYMTLRGVEQQVSFCCLPSHCCQVQWSWWQGRVCLDACPPRCCWQAVTLSPLLPGDVELVEGRGAASRLRVAAFKLLLNGCKGSGAAFIKWGQWSATREDIFPKVSGFCSWAHEQPSPFSC